MSEEIKFLDKFKLFKKGISIVDAIADIPVLAMFKTRTDFGSEKNMVTVSDVKGLNDKSMTFKLTRTSELDGKEMRRLCDMFSSSKTEYCFLSEAAGKVEKLLWARFR